MKRLIFVLVLVFAALQGRTQQTVEYDTMVIHPPQFNYPTVFDFPDNTITYTSPSGYHAMASGWELLKMYRWFCLGMSYVEAELGISGGWCTSNTYGVQALAQPHYLDSAMQVIGLAVRLQGELLPPLLGSLYWRLYNNAFEEQGRQYIYTGYTIDPKTGEVDSTDAEGYRRYYFSNGGAKLQDFYLAQDIPVWDTRTGGGCISNFALSIWNGVDECFREAVRNGGLRPFIDTIFIGFNIDRDDPWADPWTNITDTLICVQSAYEDQPYFKKDGEWIRFADDSMYYMIQTTFLEFLPIVLVPKAQGNVNGLSEAELSKHCSIYPNPAKNVLNIVSDFKVKVIEIHNAVGVKVSEQTLEKYETAIDISNFVAGVYTIKLQTTQGSIIKKFVVK